MKVSTSAYYSWLAQPVSDRDWADAQLTNIIVDIHRMSRHSYGSPRVHAELRLGAGIRCSRKRVERLMRQADVQGIHRRKGRGCTRRAPDAEPSNDLVNRSFDPTKPDLLWVMDVTEHPTAQGKVFLAVVLDAFSRRVVGWSIADHVRSELVVDAVQMAIWRRCPPAGQTVAHSDHGSQGGFRWLSQHLEMEVVRDGCPGSSARGSCDAGPDVVAGSPVDCATRGSGAVLGGDRPGLVERGRGRGGRRVPGGRDEMVPSGWRDAADLVGSGVGPLPVLRRA